MTATIQPLIIDRSLAAEISGVRMGTVRAWIHRGHITARPDGRVDLRELIDWLDSRDPDALATRAGLTGQDRAATDTHGNRAARMLAEALTLAEQRRVTPHDDIDTPDSGAWLRKRRM